ncbi:MAG: septal ring lytic transglycosylase RlpA family protein [Bacteroidota bacterium]
MKRIVIIPVLLISIISYTKPVPTGKPKLPQKGKASFYSDKYSGKRTANAEKYNPNLLTAAHETLPLGKLVKVTNLINNQSAIVKINDRCACARYGRIIDLSRVAATQINMISKGVVKVKIEEI